MTSVFVVEDDPHVRDAVRSLIAGTTGRYELVGEASRIDAARRTLAQADVLLLDLHLPDGSGLELLTLPSARRALTLILTMFDDNGHIFDSLRAGAIGYLLKDDVFTRLIPSLDDACAGGSPMSPSVARRVLRSFGPPSTPAGPEIGLTAREVEVVELLAHGSTYDEIARTLDISINTVRTYIRSTYEKLHVSSKTEATLEAMRLGLIRRY